MEEVEALPGQLMHKNRLQEYTQKLSLPLPAYQTINEGFSHAPRFKASVMVNGKKYSSSLMFSHRKEAEQDVAKFALECIQKEKEAKYEGDPVIMDPTYCKSILHEFSMKANMEIPKYETTEAEGVHAVYVSSLVFDGKPYTGQIGRSKKEAEQLAAHTAIQSLLGSGSGTLLREIIKSKVKLYDKFKGSDSTQSNLPVIVKPDSSKPLNDVSSPTVYLKSEGTSVNSSWEKKRKLENQSWGQNKMQSHVRLSP